MVRYFRLVPTGILARCVIDPPAGHVLGPDGWVPDSGVLAVVLTDDNLDAEEITEADAVAEFGERVTVSP